jgi:cytochrome c556
LQSSDKLQQSQTRSLRRTVAAALIGLTAMLAASAGLAADAAEDAEAALAYRRHIMKTMGEQAAALGLILQQKSNEANFALHADTLALAARTAMVAFEPKIVGGEANAEIWKDLPDFVQRLELLAERATELAQMAREKGVSVAQQQVMGVLGRCKGCHDIYTTRKER